MWVFRSPGRCPPAHLVRGYAGAISERQPPTYFPWAAAPSRGSVESGRDRVVSGLHHGRGDFTPTSAAARPSTLPADRDGAQMGDDHPTVADHARRAPWRQPRPDDGAHNARTTSRSRMPDDLMPPPARSWPRPRCSRDGDHGARVRGDRRVRNWSLDCSSSVSMSAPRVARRPHATRRFVVAEAWTEHPMTVPRPRMGGTGR